MGHQQGHSGKTPSLSYSLSYIFNKYMHFSVIFDHHSFKKAHKHNLKIIKHGSIGPLHVCVIQLMHSLTLSSLQSECIVIYSFTAGINTFIQLSTKFFFGGPKPDGED